MALLELVDAVVTYPRGGRSVRAVDGVSLSVEAGEVVGLVGESGCGKSTLAQATVGLLPLRSGQILFDGQAVRPLGAGSRAAPLRRLQMVFQDPYSSLNPRRRVGSQLADGIRRTGVERRAVRRRVEALLERVGMPATAARRYPHEFSGGQRQRIAIGRALSVNPAFIVADEPTSALDASIQAQVANLLRSLCDDHGVSLLLISHDLGLVRHLADRTAVMYLGQVVEVAPSAQLWRRPDHPYTEALISSTPSLDTMGHLPEEVLGEVPDPANPPAGCRFRPRCPCAFERCRKEPAMFVTGDGRASACWLREGVSTSPCDTT